jgi:hypothetical protein
MLLRVITEPATGMSLTRPMPVFGDHSYRSDLYG